MAVYLGSVKTRPGSAAFLSRPLAGAAAILCAIVLAGCGSQQSLNPTPLPTFPPTSTATPEVGFVVNVTAVPTVRPHHAQPTPTSFAPPTHPYIVLSRDSGPPAQQAIVVRGGHFPASSIVQLEWSLNGKKSSISTTTRTGRGGALRSSFTIPASPPGQYRVVATINGTVWAGAGYRVQSDARLSGRVSSVSRGEQIHVRGKHFLPHVKLLLVAYPMSARGKPVIVGTVRTDAKGAFTYTRTLTKLPMGQYALRAWSQNAFAAQMAETFIQVVI